MPDPKGNVQLLPNFPTGTRVKLSRVKREAYAGLNGTVVKTIKRHGEVKVQLDFDRTFYHAFPENLDILKES